jgi:hypothetical protein
MMVAFAIALWCSGDCVSRIHAAKASGQGLSCAFKIGLLRLALPRNAMRILALFVIENINEVSFPGTCREGIKKAERWQWRKKDSRLAKNLTIPDMPV